jgi:hypothetical protein
MLTTYSKLEDVPEALREHYKLIEGRYVPEISDDHPVKATNAALKTEKDGVEAKLVNAQTELTTAKTELETARHKGLPHGHVAVPKADAELIGLVKASGVTTAEAFTAMKTELDILKPKVQEQERRDNLKAVADHYKWNSETLYRVPGLPEIEWREVEVNGAKVKTPHAKVKNGEEVSFEPLDKYVANSADLKIFTPSLALEKQPEGTPLPSHGAGGGSADTDLIAQRLKAREAARTAQSNPLMPKVAVAA